MGQEGSKEKQQKLIITSVNKIRKDLRNGKITTINVEEVQQILSRYRSEIGPANDVKVPGGYTILGLIDITSKELDGLKQEVNLDSDAISTNSFKRYSARNSTKESKEKRKSIKSISESVQGIRQKVRSRPLSQVEYDKLQQDLANYSKQLGSRTRKAEADTAQKLISAVLEEVVLKQQENAETGSLKRKSVLSKRSSLGENRVSLKEEPKKEQPQINSKNTTGTLNDIESKLSTLNDEMKVAENNKDSSRLRFLSKSIQTLMTDLQMVVMKSDLVDEERKTILEKNLQQSYQEIEKIKRHLADETDSKKELEVQDKHKKGKAVKELDDFKKALLGLNAKLTHSNFQPEKQTFLKYKDQVDRIEENSNEIIAKKKEVNDVLSTVESTIIRLEMEERLNQAEWRHCQYKLDLSSFEGTTADDSYNKHRQYLVQLKEYVNKVREINKKVEEKKVYLLYNIDNNIAALDLKAKENQPKTKEKAVEVKSPKEILSQFCHEISKYDKDELKAILPLINEARKTIEEELQLTKSDNEVQLVTVKEKKLERQEHFDLSIEKDPTKKPDVVQQANLTEAKNVGVKMRNQPEVDSVVTKRETSSLIARNKLSNRKSATEDILVDIMSVSTRINELGNKIKSHSVQDYDFIKSSLLENQNYLRSLKIGANRTNLHKSRDEILLQIDKYLTDLSNDKQNDFDSEDEKKFNQELRKIKEKVNRYSGTYKNILYKSIEKDLDKCLDQAAEVFTDTGNISVVKQDIEKTKLILEQKSTKDQKVVQCRSNELDNIKREVETVGQALNQKNSSSKEDLDKLDAKLTLCVLALDNTNDDCCTEKRNQLYQETHTLFQKIQELTLVDVTPKTSPASIVASVQNDLEAIRPKVMSFIGTETNPNFIELDEVLVRGTLKLDELNLDQMDPLYRTKLKLMKTMTEFSDVLDDRIRQTEEVEKVDKQIQVLLMKIDAFNGYYGDNEYAILDEEIINLKVKLGKVFVCAELIPRKDECIKNVNNCMRKLSEMAKVRPDAIGGTLV